MTVLQDAQAFWDADAPATFTTYVPGVGESPGLPISRTLSDLSTLQAKVDEMIQGVIAMYGQDAQVTALGISSIQPPLPGKPRIYTLTVHCRPAVSVGG